MEKIIHQIWVGKFEMPDREKRFIEKLITMNPSYEHKLWVNDNIPENYQILCKMRKFETSPGSFTIKIQYPNNYLIKNINT